MAIDDVLNRREFLGRSLQITAGSILLPEVLYAQSAKNTKPKEDFTKKRVTRRQKAAFAKAKRYASYGERYNAKLNLYLQDLLVNVTGLVFDADKNNKGIVGEFFYMGDPEKRELGLQRVLKEEGGTRKGKEQRIERMLPVWKIESRYSGLPGQKKRKSYFLIDKSLFNLATADEVFSVLDRAQTMAHAIEYDLHIDGKNLNLAENETTRIFGMGDKNKVIAANARSVQVANILSGLRTVTPEFRENDEIRYLASYHWSQMHYGIIDASIKEARDKFGKKWPHFPIYEHVQNVLGTLNKEMDSRAEAAGYRHTPSKFRTSWSLEKIPSR